MLKTRLIIFNCDWRKIYANHKHCVKSILIPSYSGPYFPAFRLNTERKLVSLRIQSGYGKIQIRITPNKDTFYAVKMTIKRSLDHKQKQFHFLSSDYRRSKFLLTSRRDNINKFLCWFWFRNYKYIFKREKLYRSKTFVNFANFGTLRESFAKLSEFHFHIQHLNKANC